MWQIHAGAKLNSGTGTYHVSVLFGHFPLRSSLNYMMLSPNPQKDAHPTKIVIRTDSSTGMADFSTPLTALRATAKTQLYATAVKQEHNATTGPRYSDVSYHQFEMISKPRLPTGRPSYHMTFLSSPLSVCGKYSQLSSKRATFCTDYWQAEGNIV